MTPLADFTIGLCLFVLAVLIVLLNSQRKKNQ